MNRRPLRVAALVAALALVGCGLRVGGLGDEPILVAADTAPPLSETAVVADTFVGEDTASDTEVTGTFDAAPEVAVDTAPPCPEVGSVMFEGRCYFLVTTPYGFADARAACANSAPPAHLAAITSSEEQSTIAGLAAGRELWIGLRKDAAAPSERDSFTWITGEVSSYHNWAPEDPNGGHNCARLRADRLWGDMSCGTTIASVCERD